MPGRLWLWTPITWETDTRKVECLTPIYDSEDRRYIPERTLQNYFMSRTWTDRFCFCSTLLHCFIYSSFSLFPRLFANFGSLHIYIYILPLFKSTCASINCRVRHLPRGQISISCWYKVQVYPVEHINYWEYTGESSKLASAESTIDPPKYAPDVNEVSFNRTMTSTVSPLSSCSCFSVRLVLSTFNL